MNNTVQGNDAAMMLQYLISDIIRIEGLIDSNIDYESLTNELLSKTPQEIVERHSALSHELSKHIGIYDQPNEILT